jgi:23S rRNA (cytidine1920-2'-O)/16S rRNA (cytidine1409-2'-O)-methyltransferase
MSAKSRADVALVARGLVESRAKAQAVILAGLVFSGEQRVDKAGALIAEDAPLELRGREHPWVSRGGLKLAHGLAHFAIDPRDAVAIDVGASTGGFTDVLLAGGARRVYAVDVGHGQLAWKLRQDARVVVLEKTNARRLDAGMIPEPVDLVVCDASFIGLEVVLPAALALARPGAALVALIKPQFEVGPGRVGKGGVVRDPAAPGGLRAHRGVAADAGLGRARGRAESDPRAGGQSRIPHRSAARSGGRRTCRDARFALVSRRHA